MSVEPAVVDLRAASGLARLQAWTGQHALVLSLGLGAVLRLIASDSRSLQYDDTFSIFISSRSLPEILSGTAADTMPPLYFFLLHGWMGVSLQVWFLRLLTVFLSLAVIAIHYALVAHLFGRRAAGWAAFLTAISSLQIYHAQDVRMYALLLVWQAGYLYFFARIYFVRAGGTARRAQRRDWLGLVLCGTLAMYSHNLAIFALGIPSFYLLLKWDWKAILRLAAAQITIGILALPWLILIPGQIAKVQKAWTLPQPGIVEVLQAVILFTASLPLPYILLAIVAVLSLQIFVMLAIETWRLRRAEPELLYLLCALLLPPVMLFLASYLMRPIFIPRGFLISSLAYLGLAGVVIARTWARGVGRLILGAFVLAAALSLPTFYTYDDFPRSPYRTAMQVMRETLPDRAVIIHENKLSYFPAHFYAPELNQVFVADAPDSPNNTFELASQQAMQIFPQPDLVAAVGAYQEVYFVFFSQTVEEYRAVGYSEHPDLAWLGQHFQLVEQLAFNDLEIYHFRR
jgi:mannosyltransferase